MPLVEILRTVSVDRNLKPAVGSGGYPLTILSHGWWKWVELRVPNLKISSHQLIWTLRTCHPKCPIAPLSRLPRPSYSSPRPLASSVFFVHATTSDPDVSQPASQIFTLLKTFLLFTCIRALQPLHFTKIPVTLCRIKSSSATFRRHPERSL